MTNEDRDRLVEELADAWTANKGGADRPDVNAEIGEDLAPLLEVADLLREGATTAPPLENDPTAVMLGLVPDPEVALDSKALKRARTSANFTISDLAKKLGMRGWKVATPDVFRWETQSAYVLSPALLRAIAEVLNTSPDRITTGRHEKPSWLDDVVGSPPFGLIAKRWSELRGIPVQLASAGLESRILATVHRGGRPDPAQLLQSLDAFVTAMEQADRDLE